MKVISFNVPWVAEKLKEIDKFWGVQFNWQVIYAQSPIEMKAWGESLAVLDDPMVNRWKDTEQLSILACPFKPPLSFSHLPLLGRASVRGLCLVGDKVLEVFANEGENTYAPLDGDPFNQILLGNTFVVYTNHELSHYFYWKKGLPDRTHEHFYTGRPEKAKAELSITQADVQLL